MGMGIKYIFTALLAVSLRLTLAFSEEHRLFYHLLWYCEPEIFIKGKMYMSKIDISVTSRLRSLLSENFIYSIFQTKGYTFN
jgi:hypothetical protein